jgi:GMP synthase (glutamine-hydrolysing)
MINNMNKRGVVATPKGRLTPPLSAIAIIDLGGQYCHMIGRRLRDDGVASDIFTPEVQARDLQRYAGIILSGGPRSVYSEGSPKIDENILRIGRPVLGICYGHQLLAMMLGSDVAASSREYGQSSLQVSRASPLFEGTEKHQTVWMSHGDSVRSLGDGLVKLARTKTCDVAAFADEKNRLYGVQFHPEVAHTEWGRRILWNFSRRICSVQGNETIKDRVARLVEEIRHQVGDKSVFFFVSGGVDSTVAFALCARALPRDRVLGVYVDTGLMRKNETNELVSLFETLGLADRLKIRSEGDRFLEALGEEVDPEKKRKIIGRVFVDVQNAAMREYGIEHSHWMLGQGTIYPDTVESGGATLATALIKTHHNRCEEVLNLIEMGRVIEPLTQFYKDEVRAIGNELGLDRRLTGRWPFPGPGLAIRCLGWDQRTEMAMPITLPRDLLHRIPRLNSDYVAVEFPIRTVGVQGDGRTYRRVAAIAGPLDYPALQAVSTSLCNAASQYNRVIVLVAGDASKLSQAKVRAAHTSARRLNLLREADNLVRRVMEEDGMTDTVWQFPTILIPVSVDGGGETIVLRPVNSEDGMTANFAQLPEDTVQRIGAEIRKLPGVDAVFLDVTNKPPATIEWE